MTACPIVNTGQSCVAEDARVRPSDPIGSEAYGASSIFVAHEEGVETLSELANMEIPE